MKVLRGLITLSIAIILSANLMGQAADKEVLMQIGDEKVTVEDFLHVFKKNNQTDGEINQADLLEYLDLYINFRLKVKDARELGMDTTANFKKELEGYRKQLAQPYFVDESIDEKLLAEAYERLQYDIRSSHILIKLDKDASPEDTLTAYNKIIAARERVLAGEDFGVVAAEVSEDPSARDMEATANRPPRKGNKGDLGYFTVFDMVYPFESGAYNTPPTRVSEPVRTDFGYHIIRVSNKMPAMGTVTVAHIYVPYPKSQMMEDSLAAKEKIWEAYYKLEEGEEFETVVTTYSEDKGSAGNGGKLPKFGVNRMVPEFIEAIAKIQKIDDYTQPIETSYGYHIIKLIQQNKPGSLEKEEVNLKTKLAKDSRSRMSEEAIIKKIKSEYNFTEYPEALTALTAAFDTTILVGEWDIAKASGMNATVFSLGNTNFSQQDLAKYIADKQHKRIPNIEGFVNETYKSFVDESCVDYEDARLEEKYPEFKLLVQEYSDGILLFDLTDKKVWSKAVQDSLGLKEYYEANKEKYMWGKRLDAVIFKTRHPEKVNLDDARALVKSGAGIDEVLATYNNDSTIYLSTTEGVYEMGSNNIIDMIKWKTGVSKVVDSEEGFAFVKVNSVVKPEPKQINEARGIITADYQNVLEENWIAELKTRYPVYVNQEVLARIK